MIPNSSIILEELCITRIDHDNWMTKPSLNL
jgi:hypothetical protein